MKYFLSTLTIILGVTLFAQAAPVTVTVTKAGGFVRTERYTDPSTCRSFDKIICGSSTAACFTLTYTYDDGTTTNNNNPGLVEGIQEPPVHVILTDPSGHLINEGMVTFYQDYALLEGSELFSAYEFIFDECLD